MIQKVYIVRCSYCHAPLLEPYGMDHRPKYFYTLDSIVLAMNEANWGTDNGLQVCNSCIQRHQRSKF